MSATDLDTIEVLDQLLTDGYVVVERHLDEATTADLRDRVQGLLDHERAHPFDPGPDGLNPTRACFRPTTTTGS